MRGSWSTRGPHEAVLVFLSLFLAEHALLIEMVNELSSGLIGIKHEQEYMEVRERIHRMSELLITRGIIVGRRMG